jgi:outer membrane receptor protein involved in Fe transport
MAAQRICRCVIAGCLILLGTAGARAQIATTQPAPATQAAAGANDKSDLSSVSLEDLMNVHVTSVSKQPQRISDAPAAITVIEQDDIQRSGLDNVPELLRLVRGMDVERVNANRWAITSRGLNGAFADDVLVLVDGRSIYTPVFGGVRWGTVDYSLEDLDRIEAIRGPGATLWGSNAVNGVVNIETKSARDTQGTEVSANWQVTDAWRLAASYSLLKTFVEPQNEFGENVPLVVRESIDGSAPQNQYQFHSYLDITENLQFNTSVYYVDALPTLANPPLDSPKVPEHTRLDLNLQWEPRPNMAVMIGAQNVLQNRHGSSAILIPA